MIFIGADVTKWREQVGAIADVLADEASVTRAKGVCAVVRRVTEKLGEDPEFDVLKKALDAPSAEYGAVAFTKVAARLGVVVSRRAVSEHKVGSCSCAKVRSDV